MSSSIDFEANVSEPCIASCEIILIPDRNEGGYDVAISPPTMQQCYIDSIRLGEKQLPCLVHHLDNSGLQLCTAWVQSKVVDAMVRLLLLCKQSMHHRHQEELCIVVAFVMGSLMYITGSVYM